MEQPDKVRSLAEKGGLRLNRDELLIDQHTIQFSGMPSYSTGFLDEYMSPTAAVGFDGIQPRMSTSEEGFGIPRLNQFSMIVSFARAT